MKTLIAKELIRIASIDFEDFSVNQDVAERYLLNQGLTINDYDNAFGSMLEGIHPLHVMSDEKRLKKAMEILNDYIVDFYPECDRDEGLCLKDVGLKISKY
jgi:hypothetical protein